MLWLVTVLLFAPLETFSLTDVTIGNARGTPSPSKMLKSKMPRTPPPKPTQALGSKRKRELEVEKLNEKLAEKDLKIRKLENRVKALKQRLYQSERESEREKMNVKAMMKEIDSMEEKEFGRALFHTLKKEGKRQEERVHEMRRVLKNEQEIRRAEEKRLEYVHRRGVWGGVEEILRERRRRWTESGKRISAQYELLQENFWFLYLDTAEERRKTRNFARNPRIEELAEKWKERQEAKNKRRTEYREEAKKKREWGISEIEKGLSSAHEELEMYMQGLSSAHEELEMYMQYVSLLAHEQDKMRKILRERVEKTRRNGRRTRTQVHVWKVEIDHIQVEIDRTRGEYDLLVEERGAAIKLAMSIAVDGLLYQ